MMSLTRRKCGIALVILGPVLLMAFIVLLSLYTKLYEMQLKTEIQLVNGTIAHYLWQDIPFPLNERFYFFNITNAEDFLKSGAKLKVEEVGPYTYKARWVKDILGYHTNGTVSYREIKTYYFDGENSIGNEDDVIVTFNGPLITAAKVLKNRNFMVRQAASYWLRYNDEKIIIQKTVGELTYKGYKEPIMDYSDYISPDAPFKDGKFSWFYRKNATDEGVFTVFTGHDFSTLNIIDNWEGKRSLEFWNGPSCNMINGTSVELGPPLKPNQRTYTFFQAMLCRSVTFHYTGEETVKGIPCRKFVPTNSTLGASPDDPSTSCFKTEVVLPSGVQDFSSCQFGAPVVLSFPHFYLADPALLQKVEGLSPQAGNHSSFINVEPHTGLSLALSLKFQINLHMEKTSGIPQFKEVPEGIFPVLWVDINMEFTEKWCRFIEKRLVLVEAICYSVIGVTAFLSVISFCIGTGILLCSAPSSVAIISAKESDPLIEASFHKVYADQVGFINKLNDFEDVEKLNKTEDSNSAGNSLRISEEHSSFKYIHKKG